MAANPITTTAVTDLARSLGAVSRIGLPEITKQDRAAKSRSGAVPAGIARSISGADGVAYWGITTTGAWGTTTGDDREYCYFLRSPADEAERRQTAEAIRSAWIAESRRLLGAGLGYSRNGLTGEYPTRARDHIAVVLTLLAAVESEG